MKYRDYYIERNPPEARHLKWHYVHKDYDGYEDTRTGSCRTIAECMEDIAHKEGRTKISDKDRILAALYEGDRLTFLEVLNRFNCARLAARVWDLRHEGYPIDDDDLTLKNGKRVSEYFIKNV